MGTGVRSSGPEPKVMRDEIGAKLPPLVAAGAPRVPIDTAWDDVSTPSRAVRFRPERGIEDLNDLIAADSKVIAHAAIQISDVGQILVYGSGAGSAALRSEDWRMAAASAWPSAHARLIVRRTGFSAHGIGTCGWGIDAGLKRKYPDRGGRPDR